MFSLIFALALYSLTGSVNLIPAVSGSGPALPQAESPRRYLEIASSAAPLSVTSVSGPVKRDASRLGVETDSRAVAVMDWESGRMLFSKNAEEPMPIASITKLMSALVFLENEPDWGREMTIVREDDRVGDLPVIRPGDRVTVENLFNLSLVSSSNDATVALARSTGMSQEEFAREMDRMGSRIGLAGHGFVEPTGLDSGNRATAADVARLVKRALSDERISKAVLSGSYEFETLDGDRRRVWNTDQLLDSFLTRSPYSFHGGKTGYISQAGYCFGAAASNGSGNRVIAVVLGANTKESRFTEVKRLLWWAFDAWDWGV
ncbi:D-alanyl-D-alanine carboxypeptidase [Candidatus Uhrbacteria bacterium]|nr:D-alanyl-D-alanine carboxypeptidase [Candidatus Uhrbacteria bacterium]